LRKIQINQPIRCIWLVDLFECMMMHALTNPKFKMRKSSSWTI